MIQRGEIWWVSFGAPSGSGPGYRRPVLVVSADAFNRSRIATVVVAVISSNMSLADAPGNVELRSDDSGLAKDSVVNVSRLATIDKRELDSRVALLPPELIDRVEQGLRVVLDLGAA